MASTWFLDILLFLLLHQVYSEEAEPVFNEEGSFMEMGYCFGEDYIVVYRSAPEGDQLLGNSSVDDIPNDSPADLRGRIHINRHQQLLGLEIINLTSMDSGIYRRECWQNHTLVNQQTNRLFVCDEQGGYEEIIVRKEDGVAQLRCSSTSIGLEGTYVRWYHEMHPSYKLTLLLDSSMSPDPLVDELKGAVEARDSGAVIFLNKNMLKNNPHFYCVVFKGKKCLSFQKMYPTEQYDSREMFVSQGDKVVLDCPSDGNNQQWDTPVGKINGSSMRSSQMYISFGEKSEDFSLVIPAVSDEHSGDYSCLSLTVEDHYSLVLCPKNDSQKQFFSESGDIFIDCDVGNGNNQRVLWHILQPSGEYELIHDSHDDTVPIPLDLRGRLTLSDDGTSLAISHLEVRNQGVYRCVVLEDPHTLDQDDYEGEYAGEYSSEDEEHWFDTKGCIFKQETILSLTEKSRLGVELESVTDKPVNINFETTAEPPAPSNVALYAVWPVLACLLMVGVVFVAVIARRRARARQEQRGEASRLGLNTTKDASVISHSDCAESLTNNDDYSK